VEANNGASPSRDNEALLYLGSLHLAILAVEAILAEQPPVKTGPRIDFDRDGYPT
jgi:hypothetical protein